MKAGDVVTIRGHAYKVVGFRDDGEPRLRRLTNPIVKMPGGGMWADR